MTTPDDSAPPEDFSDSDQAWFARLRGEPADARHARAIAEADALRRALALERAQADGDARLAAALAPAERERRRRSLHERLRQEGLAGRDASPRPRWRRVGAPAGLALAASLLLAVILLPRGGGVPTVYYDPEPALRGEPAMDHRKDAHPKAAADALAARLQAAGLVAMQYQHGTTFIVDVNVPAGIDERAVAALRASGLAPTRGAVRVEFAPD